MQKNDDIYVVIVSGGTGSRFGSSLPKQYSHLAGQPIIAHSLSFFQKLFPPQNICVVLDEEYKHMANGLLIAPAGDDRKASVRNGLQALRGVEGDNLVLIHDAARPVLYDADIAALIAKVRETGAATLAKRVSNTLRHEAGATIDREGVWEILTPQAFRYDLLRKAHERFAGDDSFTDDAGMVEALGHHVALVPGSAQNIKITYQEDLQMAEKLLQRSMVTRTGMGFDVHAFDRENTGPLILGGIEIPHEFKLKGHSDADVALHTITDALLGAIGAGDIGEHFPPTDNTFKGMDSAIFLDKSVDLLRGRGGQINNIDVTIICETPKLMPYKKDMEERIASICAVDISQVNVKATTTEKLGFTGRKEGIAAQAVVSVELPR